MLNTVLPKWPAFFVEGKTVTKEQAAEIIVRTDSCNFFCNDPEWQYTLLDHMGFINPVGANYDALIRNNDVRVYWRLLELEYLSNAQIATAYAHGPRGWCSWDGTIFCNNINIGKWPTVTEVLCEWEIIAQAFPFLDLVSVLFDSEYCEDNAQPLVEFRVKNGRASVHPPEYSAYVEDVGYDDCALLYRGCDEKTFLWALEQVKKGKYR